jgi:hypothetical protein
MALKRMSAMDLDKAAEMLTELEQDVEDLRERLRQQIQQYGFTPPRSEKSKRLQGLEYQFTLSTSTATEVNDFEAQKIATVCEPEVFNLLFKPVTHYKVALGASAMLARTPLPAGLPSTIRAMWARAVTFKENKPRMRIERIGIAEEETAAV